MRSRALRGTNDARTLRRFVAAVPGLQRLLTSADASPDELLLRHEMRRTIAKLSDVFHEAACIEPSNARAAAYREASQLAAALAARSSSATPRGHH
jgi:hypothetical protein